MTATELAARIRRRELSPVELVDAFIAREVDPLIGCRYADADVLAASRQPRAAAY